MIFNMYFEIWLETLHFKNSFYEWISALEGGCEGGFDHLPLGIFNFWKRSNF